MALLSPLISLLARILPPTIHPMVLHFPIVLLYITAGIDVLARILPDRDRFLQRAGFWTLTLACFFTVVTMAVGLVSEQAVHWTPQLQAILERHQTFAMLTGLAEGAAWLVRLGSRFPRRDSGWQIFGRGRGGWGSTTLVLLAAASITMTAYLGGKMVYDHGAGVLGVTRGVVAAAPRAPLA